MIIIIIIIIIIIEKSLSKPLQWLTCACLNWLVRMAVILCGGIKAQKQQSHRLSFKFRLLDCRTGYLNWYSGTIANWCGTDLYSIMKKHVISIEEVSC